MAANFFPTDPIALGAQAREILTKLHERKDVVVRLKTDRSGYDSDKLSKKDQEADTGGHYQDDRKVLTINLDKVLSFGKDAPEKLDTIEDWRLFPVLAGVAAHESAHAKYTRWHDTAENPFPQSLVNPDYNPDHPKRWVPNPDWRPKPTDDTDPNYEADQLASLLPERIEDVDYQGPEYFPVREVGGKLVELAKVLEEPRVERLGRTHFTKTWKKALEFSASHLTLESVDEMDDDDQQPLDAAVNLAVLVGGRLAAGTLGATDSSRAAAQKVLDSAQKVIEASLPESTDPFHTIMGIVSSSVFDNEHDDANSHLEAARQILAIVHPESTDDPDSGKGNEDGTGGQQQSSSAAGMPGAGGEDAGEAPDPSALAAAQEALSEALEQAMAEAQEGLAELGTEGGERAEKEEEAQQAEQKSEGYGTTNEAPRLPQIDRYEEPDAADREMYRRCLDWMQRQIQPTVTEGEYGQWMAGGGSRFNPRSFIRDNLAGHRVNQRTDWDRPFETIKPAPPVKVAILLDGSGSMNTQARFSARVAWAVANAAAELPESRTVSVVFGNRAMLTQEPGRHPSKLVAVAKTNGSTEDFIGAAKLVEEHLQLGEDEELDDDGQAARNNTLIVIVSDLMFFGTGQAAAAARTTRDWKERGYTVLNVGSNPEYLSKRVGAQRADASVMTVLAGGGIDLTDAEHLFK